VVLVEGATREVGEEADRQVQVVLIKESVNIVVKAESVWVIAVRRPPVAKGLPLFL
jgi:hypothetical protein